MTPAPRTAHALSLPGRGEAFDPLLLIDPTRFDRHGGAPVDKRSDAHMPGAEARAFSGPVRNAGVEALLSAFASRSLKPSTLLQTLCDAIGTTRDGQEAVLRPVAGAEEAARESDLRWASGAPRPLEGIPFGVKDIIDVAGTMVTSGSLLTGDRIAPADASVVAALRAQGAIPFAMTATTEFACGSPHNPRFGPVTNPWDRTRWTGGSSTGSGAALAARLMPLALGTDTGGSIRVPSCWCGTTGLKPSRELVSRNGVAPLSWTLDHVGPMARSARDIARVLPFMAPSTDPQLVEACADVLVEASVAGTRIGVPTTWFTERVDAAVLANWQGALATLENLGCELVTLPPLDIEPWHNAGWVILQSELATLHSPQLDRETHFDQGLLHRLRNGLAYSAVDYGQALQARIAALDAFLDVMADLDAIVTPGLGGEAGRLDDLTVEVDGVPHAFQTVISRNTMIFDVTGLPALMLPSGLGRQGLPTGLQIVGKPGADATCLRLGAAFQAVTQFHLAAPAEVPA